MDSRSETTTSGRECTLLITTLLLITVHTWFSHVIFSFRFNLIRFVSYCICYVVLKYGRDTLIKNWRRGWVPLCRIQPLHVTENTACWSSDLDQIKCFHMVTYATTFMLYFNGNHALFYISFGEQNNLQYKGERCNTAVL